MSTFASLYLHDERFSSFSCFFFHSSAHYTQLQRVHVKSFDLASGIGVWVVLTNQVYKRGVQGTIN